MPEYRWMSLSDVNRAVPAAERARVSEVARSDRGFVKAYNQVRGNSHKMAETKVSGYPNQNWAQRRQNFIARHLAQYRENPTPRRRLALITWAYDPR